LVRVGRRLDLTLADEFADPLLAHLELLQLLVQGIPELRGLAVRLDRAPGKLAVDRGDVLADLTLVQGSDVLRREVVQVFDSGHLGLLEIELPIPGAAASRGEGGGRRNGSGARQ
jgi:hypothetical protein